METVCLALVGALVIIAGIVAFKLNVKLDVNKWRQQRREEARERLLSLCPHTELVETDEGVRFISLFHSPYGTTSWICSKCNMVTDDEGLVHRIHKMWARDPKAWSKRMKRYNKAYEKFHKL